MSTATPFVAVVDDKQFDTSCHQLAVTSAELASDTFKTGDECLDMFGSISPSRPDCVVLDIQTQGRKGSKSSAD